MVNPRLFYELLVQELFEVSSDYRVRSQLLIGLEAFLILALVRAGYVVETVLLHHLVR